MKKKKYPITELEAEDLYNRLNDVELDIAESKEFSHLSAEALLSLQNQINEFKGILIHLIMNQSTKVETANSNEMVYS